MTKHSLRPIAICVMLANGLPLLAQQPTSLAGRIAPKSNLAAAQIASVNQASVGAIEGKAQNAAGQALGNTTVRLRDVRSGKVLDTKVSDETGAFAFRSVDPGDYLVELVDSSDKVLATSKMIVLKAGESAATIVSLPAAAGLAGFLGANAPVAAIIIGSAAAAGVLAVQSNAPASPER